ncbi:MAG: ATP-binding protein [Thermoanaerobaculales bacterium]|nr:ATP-binding protein [Thermoanaerobaculales bacterium]
MTEEIAQDCPVCLEYSAYWGDPGQMIQANCPRCGEFEFSGQARALLTQEYDEVEDGKMRLGPKGSRKRANASGWIREHSGTIIYGDRVAPLASHDTPKPLERANKLLRTLGASEATETGEVNINTPEYYGRTWVKDRREITDIAKILSDQGFIEIGQQTIGPTGLVPVRITAAGWTRLEKLRSIEDNQRQLDLPLEDILEIGESGSIEFKSSLRFNLKSEKNDPKIEMAVLKTIAGFLNVNGGTLLIGVTDDGRPLGIEVDGFESEDRAQQHLINLMRDKIGLEQVLNVRVSFEQIDDHRVMVVRCSPAASEVWVRAGGNEQFFIRAGNTTNELSPSKAAKYISGRFDH